MSSLVQLAARFRVDTVEVDGLVIATCPLLAHVTQGSSVRQALDRIREEIQALVAFASRQGVLREMFQHRVRLPALEGHQQITSTPETHWIDVALPIEAIQELSQAA
jgi:hypothetical protein